MAVLCYSGLRLAEAAALTWDRVDFEKRIIAVRPSDAYPSLKSDLSERPVKPFQEIWPILREHETLKLSQRWIFPRPSFQDQSWFHEVCGEARLVHLSVALSRALRKAGLKDVREPNRRARRYWETRMRSVGRADLIEIMGGHTDQVGLDHYTNARTIVERLAGDAF